MSGSYKKNQRIGFINRIFIFYLLLTIVLFLLLNLDNITNNK